MLLVMSMLSYFTKWPVDLALASILAEVCPHTTSRTRPAANTAGVLLGDMPRLCWARVPAYMFDLGPKWLQTHRTYTEYPHLCLCASVSLCVCVVVPLCLSVSLCVSLCLSVSLWLSLSLSVSLCLSHLVCKSGVMARPNTHANTRRLTY